MTQRINRKDLENILAQIAAATNCAISEKQAIEMGKPHFLQLDHNSIYGGYRVVNVGVKNGAHYGAFGGNGCEGRISAKNMYLRLTSMLQGLEMASK